ncbi:MAG TPA: hypothetical protein PLW86_16335, partial [Rhodocyclaceae bacterium]|nr:hypothetical protein [Rhodocyclaceae bacterium]
IQGFAESEVHRAWLLHFINHEPKEVHFTPALSHTEVLTWYPLAVAAEPIEAAQRECWPRLSGDHYRNKIRPLSHHDADGDPATK